MMSKPTPILLTLSLILALAGSAFAVDPLFAPAVNYGAGDGPISVFSTDLDGDGDNDLAVANYGSDNVSVLLNNGDGTFAEAVNYAVGYMPHSVFSADLDGDNDDDLAVANTASCDVSILLNNGDGTFAPPVNYGVGTLSASSIFSADLDGDGDYDLAVANQQVSHVSILLNNGDGTFAAAILYGSGGYGSWSVFLADLDGDNDNDLAVPNYKSDNVSILLNNGDGTFTAPVNYGVGDMPFYVFSVDLDDDNDNDLAVANKNSHNISILLNNGDGTFAEAVNYAAAAYPYSVFSADLDGDGDNDVVVTSFSRDKVSILLNNGDGTFAAPVNYGVGDEPVSVFSADLDGDNDNDLAVANFRSDNVSILLNLSGPYVVAVHLDIKPGSCPNPLNVKAPKIDIWVETDETPIASKSAPDRPQEPKAVLPVAILGTVGFDVADIDPATVTLIGVPALRWNIEDVSTPVGEEAEECECNSLGADGYDDLTLKFDRSLIVEALGEVFDGDTIPLVITGELTDGMAIEATDCVIIKGDSPPAESAAAQIEPTLLGNYPNPFNPITEISFSLPTASDVKLEVFNVMGQKVTTLLDDRLEAGEHIVQWDGSDAASGVYLYRLQADDFVDAKKMMLLK